jgi:hypothetical protein
LIQLNEAGERTGGNEAVSGAIATAIDDAAIGGLRGPYAIKNYSLVRCE